MTFSKPDRHHAPSALRCLDPKDDVIVTEDEGPRARCLYPTLIPSTAMHISSGSLMHLNADSRPALSVRIVVLQSRKAMCNSFVRESVFSDTSDKSECLGG